ncbi:MAG: hypothetical protein NC086_02455 [Alistipes sp.]|nr:hypothetical protein [Alistipes sp.]
MLKMKSKRAWAILLTLIFLVVYSSADLSIANAAQNVDSDWVDANMNPGDDNRGAFRMGTVRLNGTTGGIVKNEDSGEANLYMFFELTSLNEKDTDGRRLNQQKDIKGEFYFYLCTDYDPNDSSLSNTDSVDYSARNIVYVFDPVPITNWNDIPEADQALYIESESKRADLTKNNTLVGICNSQVDIASFGQNTLYLSVYFKADDDSAYRSKHSKFRRPITINAAAVSTQPPTVDPVTSPIIYGESAIVDVTPHSSTAASGTLEFYIEDTLLTTKTVTVGNTEHIEIDSQYLKGTGSYKVTARFTPDGSTAPVESTESFDVLPRPITLKPGDVALRLGSVLPAGYEWSVTAGNLVFDDELQGIVVTPDITDANTPQTGTLSMSQQNADVSPNRNYDITFEPGAINVGENTPPTITNVTFDPNITKEDIPVTFDVDDLETEKNKLTVSVFKGTDKTPANEVPSTNTNGNCSFTATENGIYTLVVTDEHGGSAETTVTIDTIDKIPPTLTPVPDTTESTAVSVTVTVNAEDTADKNAAEDTPGIDHITVTDSSGNPVPVTDDGKFTVDKNGTYTIIVTDKAGNSATTTIDITNISQEPSTQAPSEDEEGDEDPEPTAAPNNTGITSPVTGDTTPILFLTVVLMAALLTIGCATVNKITDKESK